MKNAPYRSGLLLATAAAALFANGLAMAEGTEAKEAKVHCSGINACKGQSACKTARNACKGQNSCEGQGWLPTAEECTAKGGKVLEK
jgi:hypothetical protein